MLSWLTRGLEQGRSTTRYPRCPEPAPDGFQGQIKLRETSSAPAGAELPELCPTGAIGHDRSGALIVDRGRCILCGECVRRRPELFAFEPRFESAVRSRGELLERSTGAAVLGADGAARPALGDQAKALRRSIHIRHIDTGSDGSEEWEIQALWNPSYDIQRLGFYLTSAPRHADILLVTGGVTAPMRGPLELTWELMGAPKVLVAVGTDACSGGLAGDGPETAGGVDRVLPVDVYIPGAPPSPIALIDGLLLAVGRLRDGDHR